MKISSLTVRACAASTDVTVDKLRGEKQADSLGYLVYTLTTEDGQSASMFGFAGASAVGSAHLAASLDTFLKGRDARDRERIWHDFRQHDRFWALLPVYIWGPVDCCLWLLAAQAAGQPLYKYIGACRDSVPVYMSSMFHDGADSYVAEAKLAKETGLAAYKLHPPGKSIEADLEIHAACRDAVGDFGLMSDPVSSMSYPEALRYGRGLEDLDFIWFEEPMQDENLFALQSLTQSLDIPVIGTETLAKHPYSVATCISERIVDIVRADVSWSGGVTSVLKTGHIAEGFGVNCEIHTAIFHPLEMVNLHLCAALKNCSYFELLMPLEKFAFGLTEPLPIENGVAHLPARPGLGRDLDWDFIDNTTIATV